jgi:hypothetical protein
VLQPPLTLLTLLLLSANGVPLLFLEEPSQLPVELLPPLAGLSLFPFRLMPPTIIA